MRHCEGRPRVEGRLAEAGGDDSLDYSLQRISGVSHTYISCWI